MTYLYKTQQSKFKLDNNNAFDQRCANARRKKGCFWNPLNLLSGTKGFNFGTGRQLTSDERDELQRRVKHLEKRLCFITQKIDKCEHNKQEEDYEDQEDTEDSDALTDHGGKDTNCKNTHQSYTVQLKQPKSLRKQSAKEYMKFGMARSIHIKDMKGKYRYPLSRESRSGAWNVKNNYDTKRQIPWDCKSSWESRSAWDTKSNAWEKKTTWEDSKTNPWMGKKSPWEAKSSVFDKSNINQISDQCVMQAQVEESEKSWSESIGDHLKNSVRSTSDEPVTKKNVKTIIDEAIVDSIGKTLQKYFKDSLDDYIKKRVDSAVHLYNGVSGFPPNTQASFSSRPKTNTSVSSVEVQDFQSAAKMNENDYPKECSAAEKTISTLTTASTTITAADPKSILGRNKLAPKSAHMTLKYKYSDIRSWTSKTDEVKPVSAPSYVKAVLSSRAQSPENKTLQILKGNCMKPFPSDRIVQRKLFRKKIG